MQEKLRDVSRYLKMKYFLHEAVKLSTVLKNSMFVLNKMK